MRYSDEYTDDNIIHRSRENYRAEYTHKHGTDHTPLLIVAIETEEIEIESGIRLKQ